jgi:nucleotide-binding universal stress UspA family protein
MLIAVHEEPGRALRRVVRREHRDRLVVGSGRDAADGRVVVGHPARDLIGHLECPLAIAPLGLRDRSKRRLERVGVGFDGWPEARAGFGLAGSIALTASAELVVQPIIDEQVPRQLMVEEVVLGGEVSPVTEARWLLREALAVAGATGASRRVEFRRGSVPQALGKLASGVDLLVVGSGRSDPAGCVSLGEKASAVVDGAPCPVMIVPRPADAAA